MTTIYNPILHGFHPDPCIIKVGSIYYVANSTFEWYPGVRIYKSSDLTHWELADSPLVYPDHLDLSSVPSSGGIWACDISFKNGRFFLTYTQVDQFERSPGSNQGFKDTINFVTTTDRIGGSWSPRVLLNSTGFDPSLFHDDDGTSYLLNMVWDYRSNQHNFGGIVIQEFNTENLHPIGQPRLIFSGTPIGYTEGPHVYKHHDWYYLVTAEGGTSFGHCVTVARSKTIFGPYELHPQTPFFSSVVDRNGFDQAKIQGKSVLKFCTDDLQKAGHASWAPISGDDWVMAFLCARPLPNTALCPLGRETALELLTWCEDWPWPHSRVPRSIIQLESEKSVRPTNYQWVEHFNIDRLDDNLQTLRVPIKTWGRLERPSWLRMMGGQSPVSPKRHVLARRISSHSWKAECTLIAHPTTFQHMAGLIVRYDEANQVGIFFSHDEQRQCDVVFVLSVDNKQILTGEPVDIPVRSAVRLQARCIDSIITFYWSVREADWEQVNPSFDFGLLSDDHAKPIGFTGSFIGITCCDLASTGFFADFDYLSYSEPVVKSTRSGSAISTAKPLF